LLVKCGWGGWLPRGNNNNFFINVITKIRDNTFIGNISYINRNNNFFKNKLNDKKYLGTTINGYETAGVCIDNKYRNYGFLDNIFYFYLNNSSIQDTWLWTKDKDKIYFYYGFEYLYEKSSNSPLKNLNNEYIMRYEKNKKINNVIEYKLNNINKEFIKIECINQTTIKNYNLCGLYVIMNSILITNISKYFPDRIDILNNKDITKNFISKIKELIFNYLNYLLKNKNKDYYYKYFYKKNQNSINLVKNNPNNIYEANGIFKFIKEINNINKDLIEHINIINDDKYYFNTDLFNQYVIIVENSLSSIGPDLTFSSPIFFNDENLKIIKNFYNLNNYIITFIIGDSNHWKCYTVNKYLNNEIKYQYIYIDSSNRSINNLIQQKIINITSCNSFEHFLEKIYTENKNILLNQIKNKKINIKTEYSYINLSFFKNSKYSSYFKEITNNFQDIDKIIQNELNKQEEAKNKNLYKKINNVISTYDKNKYLPTDKFNKNYELSTYKENNINLVKNSINSLIKNCGGGNWLPISKNKDFFINIIKLKIENNIFIGHVSYIDFNNLNDKLENKKYLGPEIIGLETAAVCIANRFREYGFLEYLFYNYLNNPIINDTWLLTTDKDKIYFYYGYEYLYTDNSNQPITNSKNEYIMRYKKNRSILFNNISINNNKFNKISCVKNNNDNKKLYALINALLITNISKYFKDQVDLIFDNNLINYLIKKFKQNNRTHINLNYKKKNISYYFNTDLLYQYRIIINDNNFLNFKNTIYSSNIFLDDNNLKIIKNYYNLNSYILTFIILNDKPECYTVNKIENKEYQYLYMSSLDNNIDKDIGDKIITILSCKSFENFLENIYIEFINRIKNKTYTNTDVIKNLEWFKTSKYSTFFKEITKNFTEINSLKFQNIQKQSIIKVFIYQIRVNNGYNKYSFKKIKKVNNSAPEIKSKEFNKNNDKYLLYTENIIEDIKQNTDKNISQNILKDDNEILLLYEEYYTFSARLRYNKNFTNNTSKNNLFIRLKTTIYNNIINLLEESKKIMINYIKNNSNIIDKIIDKITDDNNIVLRFKEKESSKIIVMGDQHGSFHSFFRIIIRLKIMNIIDNNYKLDNNYKIIFLGDILDRGLFAIEILYIIFKLIIANNNENELKIILNRGNHEEYNTYRRYGFENEFFKITLKNKENKQYDEYLKNINNNFKDFFKYCSSAIILEHNNINYWLCHGGFPDDLKSLDIIENNPKNLIYIINNVINKNYETSEIRWNDFINTPNNIYGARGPNTYFIGTESLNLFKEKLNINFIIRGHTDNISNAMLLSKININIDKDDYWFHINDTNYIEHIKEINKEKDLDKLITYNTLKLSKKADNEIAIINSSNFNDIDKNILYPVLTISNNCDNDRNLYNDSYVIIESV